MNPTTSELALFSLEAANRDAAAQFLFSAKCAFSWAGHLSESFKLRLLVWGGVGKLVSVCVRCVCVCVHTCYLLESILCALMCVYMQASAHIYITRICLIDFMMYDYGRKQKWRASITLYQRKSTGNICIKTWGQKIPTKARVFSRAVSFQLLSLCCNRILMRPLLPSASVGVNPKTLIAMVIQSI